MNHLKKALSTTKMLKNICFTLLTATAIESQAASVWKVTSDKSTLYIGGTIHLLTADDYPLPDVYETAYQASSKVIFETNMEVMRRPSFKKNLEAEMLYKGGKTIDQALQPETYQKLETYLESRNIPIAAVRSLKPSALAVSLSVVELKHLGFTSIGVDQFYTNKAIEDEKPRGWLEEPEQQIALISDLNVQDDNQMIEYALSEIEDMSETINSLRESWRTGDMKTMEALEQTELKRDYPEIYNTLLVRRNERWMPQIEVMLDNKEVEFVMVGAMHLAGEDSLLNTLKNKGYQVEKL